MSKPTCPAALNITGEHYPCDWPTDANGSHDGWAHANRDAGEGALRHECGTGSLCDGWPFGVDDAYRTIAAVSWPAEREENRDGWAVTMRHRADLFEQEASRARERLEAAITHGRAALTDTAGDDREHDHGDWNKEQQPGEGALRERVEAVLFLACHHCGRLPDQDGDHSCPCPTPDSECLQHTLHPVAPLDMIRAALTDTAGDDRGEGR